MRQLLTTLINVIFPATKQSLLLRDTSMTAQKLYQPNQYKNIYYLSTYTNPYTKAAILENKFHHNKNATVLLGEILKIWTTKQTDALVIIPIPLGKKRRRTRGYNQVEQIANTLTDTLTVRTDILQRTRDTSPQSDLPKNERLLNIENAFCLHKKKLAALHGKHVVLLDDVVTTGATLQAARAILAHHLPPDTTLTCLAIAH